MAFFSFLGLLLSILFLVYSTIKGYSVIFIAPLATLIVLLTNQSSVLDGLLVGNRSYMAYLSDFVGQYFFLFFLGALLGLLMEKSGACESIARSSLKAIGTKRPFWAMLAILLMTSLLTYGGVSIFVVLFTIVPLCRPIFKAMDVKWSLVSIPVMLGASTFTMSMLPASPAIQNVIPTQTLGTSLTAAPLLGLLATALTLVYGLTYMFVQLNKSLKAGEGFDSDEGVVEVEEDFSLAEDSLPHLYQSITPLCIMIITIIMFSHLDQIIILALVLANLSCLMLNRKRLFPQFKQLVQQVSNTAMVPLFVTASSIAYGSVLSHTPAFGSMIDVIQALPLSPAAILALLAMILTLVTASAAGSIGIIMTQFADRFLQAGLPADFIHRLTNIASATTTPLPYGGVIMNFNQLTGLELKDTYSHIFIVVAGSHLLVTLIILLLA